MNLVKNLKGITTAPLGQRDEEDYMWLGKKLEELFIQEDEVETRKLEAVQDWFRPSSLTYKWGSGVCPRYWHYIFTHEQRAQMNKPLDIARMGYGTHRHTILQEKAELLEEFVENERPLSMQNPTMQGSCDMVLSVNGEEIIGEIKTTKHEHWVRRQIEGPPHYNILQVCLYIHMAGLKRGVILIEDNNTREVLIFPVEYNEELRAEIEKLFEWMRTVERTVKEEELLPERVFTKSSYNCKGCAFKKKCWSDEDGDIKLDASPAFLEAK